MCVCVCVCVFQLQENAEDPVDVAAAVAGALDQCDVACLLYDGSDPKSFSVAASMMVRPADLVKKSLIKVLPACCLGCY